MEHGAAPVRHRRIQPVFVQAAELLHTAAHRAAIRIFPETAPDSWPVATVNPHGCQDIRQTHGPERDLKISSKRRMQLRHSPRQTAKEM